MAMLAGSPNVSPLTAWMVASDGAAIPYRIRGTGPALIMIHGWSQSGAMFQRQLDALSDKFTVIVPDLRGHGEAPDPGHGLRMARLGQDLSELMDHLKLHSATLLGWSMGVSVIWAYIDLYGTARVDRLIQVDQPAMLTILPTMDAAEAMECGALFTLAQLADLHTALLSPEGNTHRAGFVSGMVTKTIAPDLLDWIQAENTKTPMSVAAALLFSHCTNDWRDVVDRIDRPTLVIGGSVSHVNPSSQRYIHGRIAGSVYHEFPAEDGGAHFPFLEAPDAFNRVVSDFLLTH